LTDANILQTQVLTISDVFSTLDLPQRIAVARREIGGRIVFTTSFSIEDQAIADAIFTQSLEIDLLTLDTGRLFPETYELWSNTERHYGRRIRALYPDHQRLETLVARQGVNGFRASVGARQACCTTRKIEPLGRALAGAAAWITGLRAEQSPGRALITSASVDQQYQLIKINPLFDWTRDRVAGYVRDRNVPYNPLHDRGFLSIGCQPCTRAVSPGQPERAGRWWWDQEEKKECGLHARLPAFLDESNQA
jgi:phosphoadenosine phosphosulfate reductase